MPFNDLERIKNNQELYGDISTDDEAMILADNSLSTEEKNVAVLSPDTYKQKKKQYSVEDEMAKYPALFSNLKIPSMYAMTAAHKDELKKYEDEFYAESKKQGALANAWNSFWYSRKAMEISALDADRMDAIRDNDEAKLDKKAFKKKRAAMGMSIGARVAAEIEKETGFETRVTVLGHLQRGGTPDSYDRFMATQFGAAAADFAARGEFGKILVWQNHKIVGIPLEDVASQIKSIELDNPMIKTAKSVGISFGD